MHILGVQEHTLGSVIHTEVNSMVDNDTPKQQVEALVQMQILSDVLIFCSPPKPLSSHSAGLVPIDQGLGEIQQKNVHLVLGNKDVPYKKDYATNLVSSQAVGPSPKNPIPSDPNLL
ncbi:hypothetical protein STEG23_036593 [Scotinomys teguina]